MMPIACNGNHCSHQQWSKKILFAAGLYHLAFALFANFWPNLWFDWLEIEPPNHILLWRVVAAMIGGLGIAMVIAARDPAHHWRTVVGGLLKFSCGIIGFSIALFERTIHSRGIWLMIIDNLIWWPLFAVMAYRCLRVYAGVPTLRSQPYSVSEASAIYQLSDGKTLAEASESKLLVLIFLRHFGCTFTRQILRELEQTQLEAQRHGAELVLVHMLQRGKEIEFLSDPNGVSRITDPRCELYRAFGLGKGDLMELFGPRVWWRGIIALFKGCGVGHLAGDGLQMPGAFLFRDGKILAAQPAHSASDLPDLQQLFKSLPAAAATV